MNVITSRSAKPALLRPTAIANGTMPSRSLAKTRRFYEEVLGLDVADHPDGLVIRLGGDHAHLIEEVEGDYPPMVVLNHNGLYLETEQSPDDAYERLLAVKDQYEIRQITKPTTQHGRYAFFLLDADGNWWEFYQAPKVESADLTGGPQMDASQAREWFKSRNASAETKEES